MKSKAYSLVSGIVFATIAALHMLRMLDGYSIYIQRHEVPMIVSLPAVLIFGFLSAWGFRQLF